MITCKTCNNSDPAQFRKYGFIFQSGKKKHQKYQCLNCYATIKGELIPNE